MADFQNVGNFDAGVFTPKLGGVAPSGSSFTMDAAGIASGGAFLTSELEKRDPLIRKPLTSVTYARDIPIQTGGGWVDYVTAMNVAYGITGGSGSGAVGAGGANGTPIIQANVAKGAWLTNPEYVQQLAGYPLTGCPSAVQFIEMLYNALVRAA